MLLASIPSQAADGVSNNVLLDIISMRWFQICSLSAILDFDVIGMNVCA